jgi:hypothetical protein
LAPVPRCGILGSQCRVLGPNDLVKYLQLRFTVEDKGVFTTPWTATMTYRISPNEWQEEACSENILWYSGKDADVPRADKPDF